jgi:hypothetical protein
MSNITDKIRKLLALAADKGASEHEATRAMEVAMRLMAEHNLTHADLDEDKSSVRRGESLHEIDKKWQYIIAQAAGKLYGCVACQTYDGEKFRFIGRADNIDAADITFIFLRDQVEALYKQSLPRGMSKQDRSEYRRHFKLYCATRIYERAAKLVGARSDDLTGRALVVVESLEQEAMNALNGLGASEHKSRGIAVRVTPGSVAGMIAGEQARLRNEVKR